MSNNSNNNSSSSASNNKKSGPGRFGGLSSRPQENARQEVVFDQLAAGSGATRKMPGAFFVAISMLRSNNYQIRQNYNQEALEELAADIKERGILEPLIVRELDSGHYEVIAGERRFRAAQLAELKDVPVIVKDYDDKAARFAMLAENIQRQDLDPTDEKHFFEQLRNEFNYSIPDIAKLIRKSVGYVRNRLESNLKSLTVTEQGSEIIHNPVYKAEMLENSQSGLEIESVAPAEAVIERPKERQEASKPIRFKSATFTKFQHTLDDVLLILQSAESRPDAEAIQKIQSSIEETRLKLAELENALKNIEGDTNTANDNLPVKKAKE